VKEASKFCFVTSRSRSTSSTGRKKSSIVLDMHDKRWLCKALLVPPVHNSKKWNMDLKHGEVEGIKKRPSMRMKIVNSSRLLVSQNSQCSSRSHRLLEWCQSLINLGHIYARTFKHWGRCSKSVSCTEHAYSFVGAAAWKSIHGSPTLLESHSLKSQHRHTQP